MSLDLKNSLGAKAPSRAELAAENAALRAQLKFNETRLQVGEAKTAKLEKALQTQEDYIAWLIKQLQGPTSERRSWESLEPEAQLWLQGMALELPETPPPPKTTVKAYHKGSCVNRTQAPLFLKPGTFDGFSKGIHTFATG